MKFFSIALVIIAALAYDLGAWIWLDAKTAHDADSSSGLLLIVAVIAWIMAEIKDK